MRSRSSPDCPLMPGAVRPGQPKTRFHLRSSSEGHVPINDTEAHKFCTGLFHTKKYHHDSVCGQVKDFCLQDDCFRTAGPTVTVTPGLLPSTIFRLSSEHRALGQKERLAVRIWTSFCRLSRQPRRKRTRTYTTRRHLRLKRRSASRSARAICGDVAGSPASSE